MISHCTWHRLQTHRQNKSLRWPELARRLAAGAFALGARRFLPVLGGCRAARGLSSSESSSESSSAAAAGGAARFLVVLSGLRAARGLSSSDSSSDELASPSSLSLSSADNGSLAEQVLLLLLLKPAWCSAASAYPPCLPGKTCCCSAWRQPDAAQF